MSKTTVRIRLLSCAVVFAVIAGACTSSESDGSAPTSSPNTTAVSEPGIGSELDDGSSQLADEISEPVIAIVPDPDPTRIDLDVAVRTGVLDNGLTYYLRSNQAPGGRLELRLAVDAGSAMQDDGEAGLAHFVEHMLFNGTTNYPDNTLDQVLQRLGLEIGPDVNAYTSADETVYELTVATDDKSVSEALDVLVDWAGAATMSENAVVEERGVVREERRVRVEGGEGESYLLFDELYNQDSDYLDYTPIGSVEGILATTAQDTRRFYDRWYRPELMAVVLVGDMSLDDMEKLVTEHFETLANRGDSQERADLQAGPIVEPAFLRYTHEEVTRSAVSLDYWLPTWDDGTLGGERLLLMESILAAALSNRLDAGIETGDIRSLSPSVSPFSYNRNRRFLGMNFTGDDLEIATQDIAKAIRTAQLGGFTQAEFDEVMSQFSAGVDQYLASAATRQDNDFAAALVAYFLSGSDAGDVDAWHSRLDGLLQDLTPAELNGHFAYLMDTTAPLVVGLGPDETAVPTAEILEAAYFRGWESGSIVETAAQFDAIDVLLAIPEVSDEGERVEIPEIDGFEIRFANGATGVFVYSGISEGTVSLLAESEGGSSTLSYEEASVAGYVVNAVSDSGLGGYNSIQVDRYLAGSVASVRPYIYETAEGFSGNSSTEDVATMFELLHLLVVSPQVDDVAYRSTQLAMHDSVDSAALDPASLAFRADQSARHDDDPYQTFVPTADQIDSMSAEDALAIYQERLGTVDDLVVAVVGDVDPEVVAELFVTYIGTLPAGESDTFADHWGDVPSELLTRQVSAGDDDAGAGVDLHFAVEFESDHGADLEVELVATILQARLFESIREELGATYGGSVQAYTRDDPDKTIETYITVNGDPDRLDLISEAVLTEVTDLAQNGPTADEFNRAMAILNADYELVNNYQLLTMLLYLDRSAAPNPFTRTEGWNLLNTLTRSDVAEMANRMFPDGKFIEVRRSNS